MIMDRAADRVPLLLLLAHLALMLSRPGEACPRPCSCQQPAEVHCTFRSLMAIPPGIPRQVERMNLGFNTISRLTDSSLAGLRKLELLMMHGNDIHNIPDGAFQDLNSLQMLKLSYNKLRELSRGALRGLWSLARLHLDHNRLEVLHPDAFQGLTSLRLLQLEGNRLQQLHPHTFCTFSLLTHFPLSTLRHLHLSDNALRALPRPLLEAMPHLETLTLHGNPWSCDCNMRWFRKWSQQSPGVLKCKKDRAYEGGQLCPLCSSPSALRQKELQELDDLTCQAPVISSAQRSSAPEDTESEVTPSEEFRPALGNVSLGLRDEHGNKVDLDCSIREPDGSTRVGWAQLASGTISANVSFSVDLECPIDRGNYERLWRLIAYYSDVPAHLQREVMLEKEPNLSYRYRQDPERDALYFTGVRATMQVRPAWVMQPELDLQLNRRQSTGKLVRLLLSARTTQHLEPQEARAQDRPWVLLQNNNRTRTAHTALVGQPVQLECSVMSSGDPAVSWVLPDGSRVEAPYRAADGRLEVSESGELSIRSAEHGDAGLYYCVVHVGGDFSVLPFRLVVEESSSPPPGGEGVTAPMSGFTSERISLPCKASGSPDAELHWILPDGVVLNPNSRPAPNAVLSSNGSLVLPHAQLSDNGYYKCVAISVHGVDVLATKLTLSRRQGRPLQRPPARPQGAKGMSTRVKAPQEQDEEEEELGEGASGDGGVTEAEVPVRRAEASPRRRAQGGGVRGGHPSRSTWRRPGLQRKPLRPSSHGNEREGSVETRRRVGLSNNQIDPERWANILAKVRDRTRITTLSPSYAPTELPLTDESESTTATTEHPDEQVEDPDTDITSQSEAPTTESPLDHPEQDQTEDPSTPEPPTPESTTDSPVDLTSQYTEDETAHQITESPQHLYLEPTTDTPQDLHDPEDENLEPTTDTPQDLHNPDDENLEPTTDTPQDLHDPEDQDLEPTTDTPQDLDDPEDQDPEPTTDTPQDLHDPEDQDLEPTTDIPQDLDDPEDQDLEPTTDTPQDLDDPEDQDPEPTTDTPLDLDLPEPEQQTPDATTEPPLDIRSLYAEEQTHVIYQISDPDTDIDLFTKSTYTRARSHTVKATDRPFLTFGTAKIGTSLTDAKEKHSNPRVATETQLTATAPAAQGRRAHTRQGGRKHTQQDRRTHTTQAKEGHTTQTKERHTAQTKDKHTTQMKQRHTTQNKQRETTQVRNRQTAQVKQRVKTQDGHRHKTQSGQRVTTEDDEKHTTLTSQRLSTEGQQRHTSQTGQEEQRPKSNSGQRPDALGDRKHRTQTGQRLTTETEEKQSIQTGQRLNAEAENRHSTQAGQRDVARGRGRQRAQGRQRVPALNRQGNRKPGVRDQEKQTPSQGTSSVLHQGASRLGVSNPGERGLGEQDQGGNTHTGSEGELTTLQAPTVPPTAGSIAVNPYTRLATRPATTSATHTSTPAPVTPSPSSDTEPLTPPSSAATPQSRGSRRRVGNRRRRPGRVRNRPGDGSRSPILDRGHAQLVTTPAPIYTSSSTFTSSSSSSPLAGPTATSRPRIEKGPQAKSTAASPHSPTVPLTDSQMPSSGRVSHHQHNTGSLYDTGRVPAPESPALETKAAHDVDGRAPHVSESSRSRTHMDTSYTHRGTPRTETDTSHTHTDTSRTLETHRETAQTDTDTSHTHTDRSETHRGTAHTRTDTSQTHTHTSHTHTNISHTHTKVRPDADHSRAHDHHTPDIPRAPSSDDITTQLPRQPFSSAAPSTQHDIISGRGFQKQTYTHGAREPSQGQTNTHTQHSPNPGQTYIQRETEPSKGQTNTHTQHSPNPGQTYIQRETEPSQGQTNTHTQHSPNPGQTYIQRETEPSQGQTNTHTQHSPNPGQTYIQRETEPSQGQTNTHTQHSPNPGQTYIQRETEHSQGQTNTHTQHSPNPGQTYIQREREPSQRRTNTQHSPNPGQSYIQSERDPSQGQTYINRDRDSTPGQTYIRTEYHPNPGQTNIQRERSPSPEVTHTQTAVHRDRAPSPGQRPPLPSDPRHTGPVLRPDSSPVRPTTPAPASTPIPPTRLVLPPQMPNSGGARQASGTPTHPQSTGAAQPRPAVPAARGKPRISSTGIATVTVPAEADAHLPCVTSGEPRPFLSWTKASTGASVAQNTRIQRFEVHSNGTLIIRSTLPADQGQYICSVQNQYGEDRAVVLLVVLSEHPRVLNPRYRDATVHMGESVDLECQSQGQPHPRVTWVLPDRGMVHTGAPASMGMVQRVALFPNGTLRITQATYTDRGIYKCIASNAAGADSVTVRLHVSALPPTILQGRHENISLPEGSTAYLHCSTNGAPPPAIRWTTPDNTQLRPSQFVTGRNLFVFPNGTLFVRSLGPSDSGRYECAATNAVGAAWRAISLAVISSVASQRAHITFSSPQKTEVGYGTQLHLDCIASGDPEPRIIWRTPSKKLVDAQYSYDPRLKVFPNGTLALHSVTEKDEGDYLCVARNKMGDDYILLRVGVVTKPAKIEHKKSLSQEVTYGADLRVDCVASGLPNPKIQWALPDGTMINSVMTFNPSFSGLGRSRRYVVFDNGTLYFNEVGIREEGDYTCYADNQVGKDEMKVRVKVKVVADAPVIRNQTQAVVRVLYGESASLRCDAKGEPTPTILWFSPTSRTIPGSSDKYRIHTDGTLVIQKAQRLDGGNYTCLARNSAGQARQVTRVEILVAPPAINGLRGVANSMRVRGIRDQRKLLDCEATGTPVPRVMWVLPENVILPTPYYGSRMTVHRNGTLEIRGLKRGDAAQLICVARNEGGEARLLVQLEVLDPEEKPPPRPPVPAQQIPKTETRPLILGNPIILNCSLEGSPPTPLTWVLPNGSPLATGARFSRFFHRPDSTLLISNPTLAEGGVYRCVGRSAGVLVERSVALVPGRPPEISSRYTSPVSILNGANLQLHCQAREGTTVRLSWTLPSGVVLTQTQRAGRYAVLPNGTLSITQASAYDRGSYVCRASNEYGSAVLTVPVIIITYAPRITSGPAPSTQARRGVAVQLNCAATGLPRPEVAWETPDRTRLVVSSQPRLFGNKYLHPQGALIIQNPSPRDSGFYRCTARNVIGVDSKGTYLHVF